MTTVRAALAFLTILPVAARDGAPGERLGRPLFPAAGALVGLAAWAAHWLVSLAAGPWLAAVAAVATLAVLTGALHLDGLADAADGLLGGGTSERRLEIMRDPRVGTFGVVALVLVLLGEVGALARLDGRAALAALVVAGALSRGAMVGVSAALPYVRPSGLGSALGDRHAARDVAAAGVLSALTLVLDWRHGLLAAAFVAAAAAGVALLARARIGGATGDVYGATAETCQLAALLAFAVRP